jgi:IS5 family transposase
MRTTNKQQRSLAMMTGFERYTKKTRRETFLEEMEQVVPWRELCALIEPHYPKAGNGRPPVPMAWVWDVAVSNAASIPA